MGGPIRAVDMLSKIAIIEMRDGTIYQVELESSSQKVIMESHSDGEVWGLTCFENYAATTGDDNKMKVWNFKKRKCQYRGIIQAEVRKAPKGKGSTLSDYPDS